MAPIRARRYEAGLGELEAEPNPAVVALADRLRVAPADPVSFPAPARRRISITVQPITRMGSMPDDYLADGLVQEISHGLAGLEGVRVMSPERFDQAGPSAILEGTIRQIGDRIRLIVRLVDCADGSYLWSSRYDRLVDDGFAVQEELSRTIVEDLKTLSF
ncbi:MAG: hypothetical protein ACREMZ_09545 [Gemmatimonadales bacterium]